jgi:hypothetical protein
MVKRLSIGMMMLAWSVAPALAAGGGSDSDPVGGTIVRAVSHLLSNLFNWF